MDVRPLLTFQEQAVGKKRDNLNGGGPKIYTPTAGQQFKRISPKLKKLELKFSEHTELSESPDGFTPEKVLVLEVAGDIQKFSDELSKVNGFEYLSQNLIEDKFQSDIFFSKSEKKDIKPVKKFAYLAMSNISGLKLLHSIWKEYKENNKLPIGYNVALRDAFLQLSDIRFWDTQDRLANTFLLEDWKEQVDYYRDIDSEKLVNFEIELWFRKSSIARQLAEEKVRKTIISSGGNIVSQYTFESIGYHALLGTLPISQVDAVVRSHGEELDLMRCDEVMYFRPVGQCAVAPTDGTGFNSSVDFDDASNLEEYKASEPVVAVLDGLPLENHTALKGRISIDDPDDFEAEYDSPRNQVHGTSMCSLILHGDLSRPEKPLMRKLYVRPIMFPGKPDFNGRRTETIPENHLPLDLVHRAVRRMKVGENGQPPEAPHIKIINLSIGDPYRLFDNQLSPWAKMIDWLSFKYDVLFVISAGNIRESIVLKGINEETFKKLSPENIEAEFLKATDKQRHTLRMMSPAEAVNAITVKAVHQDEFEGEIPVGQIDPITTKGMPSPINPITLGRQRSVKPELMMPGGKLTYINRTYTANDDVRLEAADTPRFGPGLKCAFPGPSIGNVNNYCYVSGTSNAAALATRRLASLYETISDLRGISDSHALSSAPDSVILKALLVHGSEHCTNVTGLIKEHLKKKENSRTFKSDLNQILGFGQVNEQRIHGCRSNQATLLRTGVIKGDEAQEFTFPLPQSLSAKTVFRRLIITVAWTSPINAGHQEYRGAQLWVSTNRKVLNVQDGDYYHHHLKSGTVFHEVRTGDQASNFSDDDILKVTVNCRAIAGFAEVNVPYAIVATLDCPGTDLPIYEEVREAIFEGVKSEIDVV
ncbi:S8 family peptidase [Microbulbifer sp. VAAF005]|uniref:S8 family peptidase n=1 Tax=Microbulbifer sp. VAAF005 TaxID=3034230 RepID=UPI0024AC921B|nr:S8 family peptidase [Microbulbifer sp. VAAF005]WHI44624.1 S8 family peptidase [Microbulbifer sp. VAAF005]